MSLGISQMLSNILKLPFLNFNVYDKQSDENNRVSLQKMFLYCWDYLSSSGDKLNVKRYLSDLNSFKTPYDKLFSKYLITTVSQFAYLKADFFIFFPFKSNWFNIFILRKFVNIRKNYESVIFLHVKTLKSLQS